METVTLRTRLPPGSTFGPILATGARARKGFSFPAHLVYHRAASPVLVVIGAIRGRIMMVPPSAISPIIPTFAIPPPAIWDDDTPRKDRGHQQPNRQQHAHAFHGVSLLSRSIRIGPPDASTVRLCKRSRTHLASASPERHLTRRCCLHQVCVHAPRHVLHGPVALAEDRERRFSDRLESVGSLANGLRGNPRVPIREPVILS